MRGIRRNYIEAAAKIFCKPYTYTHTQKVLIHYKAKKQALSRQKDDEHE
jgi:hypothetical protein